MKKNLHIAKKILETLYWGELRSQTAIGKLFDCDASNICYLMKRYNIPRRTRVEAQKLIGDVGFRKTNRPNLAMSPSLAYIVGVLKGDGCILSFPKRAEAIIRLAIKDYGFAKSFSDALADIGLKSSLIPLGHYKGSTVPWRVDAYSQEFVRWYQGLDLRELVSQLRFNKKHALQFFKGFYESEGNLWGAPKKYYHCCSVSNTNKLLLELICSLMNGFGYDFRFSNCSKTKPRILNGRLVLFRKPVYRLVLHKKTQVKELLETIKPSISRKRWRDN